jgi:HEAT repeat protein
MKRTLIVLVGVAGIVLCGISGYGGDRWLVTNTSAETPPADSNCPAIRPIVQIVLKRDGSTLNGTLVQFLDGVYTVNVDGRRTTVAETAIKSIVFTSQQPRQPVADAEKINGLIAELCKLARQDRNASPAIITALAKIGESAIEPLLAAANEHSDAYQLIGEALRQMDRSLRPKLIDAVQTDAGHGAKLAVWWVFSHDGMASVGAMAELLNDPSPVMRKLALDTLYYLGSQSGNQLPASLADKLIKAMRDNDRELQGQAVSVLARVGLANDAVLPALLRELVNHPEPSVRSEIVFAIGGISRDLKADDPMLTKVLDALSTAMLKDPAELVRSHAATFLAYMGSRAKPVLPAVRQATDDKSARVRHYARQAIDFIESNETNPMRMRHFDPRRDEVSDSATRATLVKALLKCDVQTAELVRQLTRPSDLGIRDSLARMAAMEPTEPLMAALMAAVRADEHNSYWNQISRVLAQWGDKVLPRLDAFAADENYRVRRTVVVAWGEMNLQTLPDAFAATASDPHVLVRLSTAQSLTKQVRGGKAEILKSAIPLLMKLLEDKEIQRAGWWSGARELGDLAPSSPEVIDGLIQSMQSAKSESLRGYAAEALSRVCRKLSSQDKNVGRIVDALARRIEQETDERTRITIVSVLGRMGKSAAGALPELQKASDDPSQAVSKAAREAIASIEKSK